MYEETETPTFRRTIILIITIVAIAVVLWFGAWFFFLRDRSTHTGNTSGSKPKQGASQSTPKDSGSSGSGNATKPGGSSANGSTSSQPSGDSAASNPNQLANAGAGNVLIPALGGAAVGVTAFQVYLRRRVLSPDA